MHPTVTMLLALTALHGAAAGQSAASGLDRVGVERSFSAEELDGLAADCRQRAEGFSRRAADLRTAEERGIRRTRSSPKAPPNPWIRKTHERYAPLIDAAERQGGEAAATATSFANRALERRLAAQRD